MEGVTAYTILVHCKVCVSHVCECVCVCVCVRTLFFMFAQSVNMQHTQVKPTQHTIWYIKSLT